MYRLCAKKSRPGWTISDKPHRAPSAQVPPDREVPAVELPEDTWIQGNRDASSYL